MMFHRECRLLLLFCIGITLAPPRDVAGEGPSLPEFIQRIEIGEVSVKLPFPTFSDAMTPTEEKTALTHVAGKYPFSRFSKDSIVAPFTLSRDSIKNDAGKRIGHRVDLWFIAYGSLEAIRDEDLFAAMLETEEDEPGSGESIRKEELSARGIELVGNEEAYYRFAAPILDQVMVRGVVHGTSRSTPHSYFAAVAIADEFGDDSEYPNVWEHIKDAPQSPTPYSGFAGYAKATTLNTIPGAILIECHAVLHEPIDWFKSPNLLSSKLPLVTQDTVRSFRRTLAKRSR